ncbi:hypothetical protein CYMTET_8492 [Cymbomonas tetramitiformis]|uniref:Uncharacterized protein n=1 Tax=Cymbomonas tetramitiformis TaxID=36881 RepID=A0AAE0GTH2_9CHLO|nr:hypothetical protein CYMTET_8492 [Cymbomonas tetramitiformis]
MLASCNATVGHTTEQTCGGWGGTTVGTYWGMRIRSTGGMLDEFIGNKGFLLFLPLHLPSALYLITHYSLTHITFHHHLSPPSIPIPTTIMFPPSLLLPSPPATGLKNANSRDAVETNCVDGDASLLVDGDNATSAAPWDGCAASLASYWVRITVAAEQVVATTGVVNYGDTTHDVLEYELHVCAGASTLVTSAEFESDCSWVHTCSATVGQSNEQLCDGWVASNAGAFWALKITATGGGTPWIREINLYGFPTPPPPSPPPPPPVPPSLLPSTRRFPTLALSHYLSFPSSQLLPLQLSELHHTIASPLLNS